MVGTALLPQYLANCHCIRRHRGSKFIFTAELHLIPDPSRKVNRQRSVVEVQLAAVIGPCLDPVIDHILEGRIRSDADRCRMNLSLTVRINDNAASVDAVIDKLAVGKPKVAPRPSPDTTVPSTRCGRAKARAAAATSPSATS